MDDNIVIFDWLSFTSKIHQVSDIVDMLGLSSMPWEQVKGAHGYRDRLYFNGISIHFNGRDDMGVWCEMSGQGCRCFESLGSGDYEFLFKIIQYGDLHVTRLDVAFDDHSGLLDISRICDDTRSGEYVSKSEYWEVLESSNGSTVMHGSPKSDVRIRIYDKAAEKHCETGTHWVRVEIQLRDDRALQFISLPYDYAKFLRDKIVTEKFSPKAALAEARKKGFTTSVCAATLYSYIYKGYLLDTSRKHLIYKSKNKKSAPVPPRVLHPQLPSINNRPDYINDRQELGHWEMDCVCGKQGTKAALLVLTERVTRFELIFKMMNKTALSVVNVLDGLERRYSDFSERFKSLTVDNGSEFMDYSGMVSSIHGGFRCQVYYCHPYCSSERGSNENCNRIIRRFISKGTDIGQYSDEYIQRVQDWINHYPREIHGYASAADLADAWLSA